RGETFTTVASTRRQDSAARRSARSPASYTCPATMTVRGGVTVRKATSRTRPILHWNRSTSRRRLLVSKPKRRRHRSMRPFISPPGRRRPSLAQREQVGLRPRLRHRAAVEAVEAVAVAAVVVAAVRRRGRDGPQRGGQRADGLRQHRDPPFQYRDP